MGTAQQGGDGRRRPTEGRPHCCAAMAASRPPPSCPLRPSFSTYGFPDVPTCIPAASPATRM